MLIAGHERWYEVRLCGIDDDVAGTEERKHFSDGMYCWLEPYLHFSRYIVSTSFNINTIFRIRARESVVTPPLHFSRVKLSTTSLRIFVCWWARNTIITREGLLRSDRAKRAIGSQKRGTYIFRLACFVKEVISSPSYTRKTHRQRPRPSMRNGGLQPAGAPSSYSGKVKITPLPAGGQEGSILPLLKL